ncbi:MAG: LysM peptidoglycan-binding domain-containing protein [Myxococcota bacterium]
MRRWAAGVFVFGVGVACTDPTAERAREVIQFREPVHYTVKSGDSLSSIGEHYGVTSDDLIAWNGLESDVIEVGSDLLVWEVVDEKLPDPTMFAAADENAGNRRRRLGEAPRPRSGGTTTRRTSGWSREPSGTELPGTDDLDPGGRPKSVTSSGIFGSEVDGDLDDGLADAVAGLDGNRRTGGFETTRRTADMRSGTAERSADMERRVTSISNGPQFPSTPVTTPRLSMPAAKRCESQRAKAVGEDGMYAGDGLSSAEIKSSLSRTLGTTRRCMPPGTKGKFQVIVELKVGCNGRVSNVYTINGGGAPGSVTACIEKVLSYTAFPAHDIPDGQSFQYPINYNF